MISAGEGLRFPHEPVTLDRLRAWSSVSIDETNERYTRPLVAHAAALYAALSGQARFVLLGSIATDKYVKPLLAVFGDALLVPADFSGRGDLSRGGLLLRAAKARRELDYLPVSRVERHGPRPARRSIDSEDRRLAQARLELVILVGLPGAGKSTFYRQRFASTHVQVSRDLLKNRARTREHQLDLVKSALGAGQSVVVDNTNLTLEQRAELIREAERHGARVVGYFLDSTTQECVNRNYGRKGSAFVPVAGIFSAAKRLVPPTYSEGFDALYAVHSLPGERFEVTAQNAAPPQRASS